MNKQRMWIAWENHRRSRELSRLLDCESVILDSGASRLLKFPRFIAKTIFKLISQRPRIVFAQNPSIFLNIILLLLKPLLRYVLVSDLHNAAVVPDNPLLRKRVLYLPYRMVHKYADYTIVTNRYLAKMVKDNGGRAIILPDPIPRVGRIEKRQLKGRFAVCCICTFGGDEPVNAILDAANLLEGQETYFYITGDSKEFLRKFKKYPLNKNIIFTGYLSEAEYWKLLRSVNAVLDLTTRDNCLVCGSYEAVAVGTPLILSNKRILRETFHNAAEFCRNEGSAICIAISRIQENEEHYRKEIKRFRREFKQLWLKRYNELEKSINIALQNKA